MILVKMVPSPAHFSQLTHFLLFHFKEWFVIYLQIYENWIFSQCVGWKAFQCRLSRIFFSIIIFRSYLFVLLSV